MTRRKLKSDGNPKFYAKALNPKFYKVLDDTVPYDGGGGAGGVINNMSNTCDGCWIFALALFQMDPSPTSCVGGFYVGRTENCDGTIVYVEVQAIDDLGNIDIFKIQLTVGQVTDQMDASTGGWEGLYSLTGVRATYFIYINSLYPKAKPELGKYCNMHYVPSMTQYFDIGSGNYHTAVGTPFDWTWLGAIVNNERAFFFGGAPVCDDPTLTTGGSTYGIGFPGQPQLTEGQMLTIPQDPDYPRWPDVPNSVFPMLAGSPAYAFPKFSNPPPGQTYTTEDEIMAEYQMYDAFDPSTDDYPGFEVDAYMWQDGSGDPVLPVNPPNLPPFRYDTGYPPIYPGGATPLGVFQIGLIGGTGIIPNGTSKRIGDTVVIVTDHREDLSGNTVLITVQQPRPGSGYDGGATYPLDDLTPLEGPIPWTGAIGLAVFNWTPDSLGIVHRNLTRSQAQIDSVFELCIDTSDRKLGVCGANPKLAYASVMVGSDLYLESPHVRYLSVPEGTSCGYKLRHVQVKQPGRWRFTIQEPLAEDCQFFSEWFTVTPGPVRGLVPWPRTSRFFSLNVKDAVRVALVDRWGNLVSQAGVVVEINIPGPGGSFIQAETNEAGIATFKGIPHQTLESIGNGGLCGFGVGAAFNLVFASPAVSCGGVQPPISLQTALWAL